MVPPGPLTSFNLGSLFEYSCLLPWLDAPRLGRQPALLPRSTGGPSPPRPRPLPLFAANCTHETLLHVPLPPQPDLPSSVASLLQTSWSVVSEPNCAHTSVFGGAAVEGMWYPGVCGVRVEIPGLLFLVGHTAVMSTGSTLSLLCLDRPSSLPLPVGSGSLLGLCSSRVHELGRRCWRLPSGQG